MTAPCTVGGARADKAVPPELPYTTAFDSELGKFASVPLVGNIIDVVAVNVNVAE